VTESLKAYFGEPIDVKVLEHAEVMSDRNYPALNVAAGDQILKRGVTLRGQLSDTIYAYATSVIVISGVPSEIRRELTEERKGIGELLRESRLETYRELLSMRRIRAGQWASCLELDEGASVVARTYLIYHGQRPVIEIEEFFPVSRYGLSS
jgi:chorismate-pyruvate lyase